MAEISLRAYVQEINALIENNGVSEAIAHSQHILETYPNFIDAYKMLGKATLKRQRYKDAAENFQRVLSSLPDDTIAHMGMSAVCEAEGDLNGAIWHMERAYEVQPSNPLVQTELRRLIAQRDGAEPLKIRLSRGALARMYVRGELYPQAIADIRAALAENPEQIDLQILLAEIYNKTGKKEDAIEQAEMVLKRLPDSYDMNRMLAILLADTERDAQAKESARRVVELNPYAGHLVSLADPIDQADEQAVTLDRLEWTSEIDVDETAEPYQETAEAQHIAEDAADGAAPLSEIPEAGLAAGVAAAAGIEAAHEIEFQETEMADERNLEVPEVPDWQQENIPSDKELELSPSEEAVVNDGEEDLLPYLDQLFPEDAEKSAADLDEPALFITHDDDQSDWVSEEIVDEKSFPLEEVEAVEPGIEPVGVEAEDISDWSLTPAALTAEVEQTLAQMADDTHDWLPEDELLVNDDQETSAAEAQWLSELEEPEITFEDTKPSLTTLARKLEVSEEMPVEVEPAAGISERVEETTIEMAVEEEQAVVPFEAELTPVVVEEAVIKDEFGHTVEETITEVETVIAEEAVSEGEIEHAVEEAIAEVETGISDEIAPSTNQPVEVPAVDVLISEEQQVEDQPEEVPAVEVPAVEVPAVGEPFTEELLAGETGAGEPFAGEPPGEALPEIPAWLAGVETTTGEPPEWELAEIPPSAIGEHVEIPPAVVDEPVAISPDEPGAPETRMAASALDAAKQALSQGDPDMAADLFADLLKPEKSSADVIEETLQDLKEAVKYHPEHFGLWQSLGDAYMRTDQVKQALEAYLIAEKLLR